MDRNRETEHPVKRSAKQTNATIKGMKTPKNTNTLNWYSITPKPE